MHKLAPSCFVNLNYLGIFAPLKKEAVRIGIQISKKFILRLSILLGIMAIAMVLDIYFDNDPVEINNVDDSQQSSDEFAAVYFLGQTNSLATKTSILKTSKRKLLEQHDKFLQKYHESKNFNDYKLERREYHAASIFIRFHHLLFRDYYFIAPDDEPHLS